MCSLLGDQCVRRGGGGADLLFCLLSGHSSEHWPSPKSNPPASPWTQHSAAPADRHRHTITCSCHLNAKNNRKQCNGGLNMSLRCHIINHFLYFLIVFTASEHEVNSTSPLLAALTFSITTRLLSQGYVCLRHQKCFSSPSLSD